MDLSLPMNNTLFIGLLRDNTLYISTVVPLQIHIDGPDLRIDVLAVKHTAVYRCDLELNSHRAQRRTFYIEFRLTVFGNYYKWITIVVILTLLQYSYYNCTHTAHDDVKLRTGVRHRPHTGM